MLEWAEWLTEHVLLDTGHRQIVWSLPRALRPLFLRDRKLLRALPGCAWRALRKYFEQALQDKAVPGMVVSVQTFSSASLGWNPHLHSLVTEGAQNNEGEFSPLAWFDDDVLAQLFRHEVFAMLLQHDRIQPSTIETMLTWRFHGGFSVHSQTRLSPQDREGMEHVARYIARNPFAQEQVEVSDLGMVVYHHRGKPSPSGQDHEIVHPLEFLARACQHIPDAYEPRTFFFGPYSCRSRGIQNS